MSQHKGYVTLENRMGMSPCGGGESIEMQAVRRGSGTRPTQLMNQIVRLPKNPEDMLRVVNKLLALTHGELSTMAVIAECTGKEKE
jgi:hypothetical protein